jgi:putative selenate reductase
VDALNTADCASLGFTPITTCTDLLRPGGYGRLPAYLRNLEDRMRAVGARTIGDFVVRAHGQADAAIAAEAPPDAVAPLRAALSSGGDLRAAAAPYGEGLYERVVRRAAALNTPSVVAKVTADPRYRAEKNHSTPRKIGSRLWLFDCINCDKCVPVCPNDANFVYETPALETSYENFTVRAGRAVPAPGGAFAARKVHQIANFQDFCNECGNCDVFCPEDGGPYIEKPRFFGTLQSWVALRARDGYFTARHDGADAIWGRVRGREYRLEVDRGTGRGRFTDGVITVEVDHGARRAVSAAARADAPDGHILDFSAYIGMALALDGVLDLRRSNPINAALP